MLPVMPEAGTDVAAIVPLPEVPSEAPVPTNMAAEVFVPLVIAPKAADVEPVFVMVMLPAPFVIEIPVPAISVELVKPVPLPINKAPDAGATVKPVPPWFTAMVPEIPEAGTDVAAIVPLPLVFIVAPEPTVIVAEVFVPVARALKFVEPEAEALMVTEPPEFVKVTLLPATKFKRV